MIKRKTKPVICGHPERPHCALGLCRPCWSQQYVKTSKYYEAYRRGNLPEKKRKQQLKKSYNLTPEQYDEMVIARNNRCDICGLPPSGKSIRRKRLVIDHNHTTGQVRGLLCSGCNSALGLVKECSATLQGAIRYIEIHSQVPA